MALVVKNLPANAWDTREAGSIPGSGRSPGEGNGNPIQYSCLAFAQRVPWMEETGRLQSIGSHRVGHHWRAKQQQQQQDYLNSKVASAKQNISLKQLSQQGNSRVVLLPSDGFLRITEWVDAGCESSLSTRTVMFRGWMKSVHRELTVVSGYFGIYQAAQRANSLSYCECFMLLSILHF